MKTKQPPEARPRAEEDLSRNQTHPQRPAGEGGYPGELTLYHPNRKGTGSALRLQFRLNRQTGDRYNCFFLEMARQVEGSTPAGGGGSAPARFDWRRRTTVKLGFADVCRLLAVLEGKASEVGGNGLYHQTTKANTLIAFRRMTEPEGYYLAVSRKTSDGAGNSRCHILLSEAEGIGLRCLFQFGLFFMTFHADLFTFHRKERP